MPAAELYRRQTALLVRTLPFVAAESCFALKGGTAINLFVRNLPRLSVDIDLAYLPIADRTSSLASIDAALRRIGGSIARGIGGARVSPGLLAGEEYATKLIVRANHVQVSIEVAPVLRGCVYEPAMMRVAPAVEDQFGFAETQVASFPDLYAGKFVAALDRQHPRDLFDVQDLLENEGISDVLRQAFIVYLISHGRPMAELLAPTRLDVAREFERGFAGMTERPVTLEELVQTREDLIGQIVSTMPTAHRRFLLSLKKGPPDWDLLGLPGVAAPPRSVEAPEFGEAAGCEALSASHHSRSGARYSVIASNPQHPPTVAATNWRRYCDPVKQPRLPCAFVIEPGVETLEIGIFDPSTLTAAARWHQLLRARVASVRACRPSSDPPRVSRDRPTSCFILTRGCRIRCSILAHLAATAIRFSLLSASPTGTQSALSTRKRMPV